MKCKPCEQRAENVKRAIDAWKNGDKETARLEMDAMARSFKLQFWDWQVMLKHYLRGEYHDTSL